METININKLIFELEQLSEKGCVNVQIEGTLLCKEDGNSVIVSTEKQM